MIEWQKLPRKKRSVVYKIDLAAFRTMIAESSSVADVLRSIGIAPSAGNYNTVYRRMRDEGIAAEHWLPGNRRPRPKPNHRLTTEMVFVKNSPHDRSSARRLILQYDLLPQVCSVCGLGTVWNGKPITLHLDHINGIRDDHRLINLRFVCPNCDSQLPTFGGRNIFKNALS